MPLDDGEKNIHGTSHLIGRDELRKKYAKLLMRNDGVDAISSLDKQEENMEPKNKGGIIIDSSFEDDKLKDKAEKSEIEVVYKDDPYHLLILGGSGSGKTASLIGPSIFSIANAGDSMIVTDPKGELYNTYSVYLKSKGYDVVLMNYKTPSAGQNYNYLEYINQAYCFGLPQLYKAKACEMLLRYIKLIQKKRVPLYELELNHQDQVLITQTQKEFKLIELPYKQEDLGFYGKWDENTDGSRYVEFLHYFLMEALKRNANDFKAKKNDAEDYVHNNIYLHNKQDNIIKNALDIIMDLSPDKIVAFYKKRISFYKAFLASHDNDANSMDTNILKANSKIESLQKVIDYIEQDDSVFKVEWIQLYLEELQVECHHLYDEYEQLAVDSASKISKILVESAQGQHPGEKFWISTAESVLNTLILFVCRESYEDGAKHLGSVQKILSNLAVCPNPKSDDTYIDSIFNNFLTSDSIKDTQAMMRIASDKTKSSVLVSTLDPLFLWTNKAVVAQSSRSSFDISTIDEKKTCVFLNVPGEDESPIYTTLASLFIEQTYQTLIHKCDLKPTQTLDRNVYLLLDEWCNMPKLDQINGMLTMSRSRKIWFILVAQSFEQIVEKYGENTEAIIEQNSGLFYLRSKGKTTERLSKEFGYRTVQEVSFNMSESNNKKGGDIITSDTNISQSERQAAKLLYTPQELNEFPKGKGIFVAHGDAPAEVKLLPVFEYPMYKELVEATDISLPRPREDIEYFVPETEEGSGKSYKNFIYAYTGFNGNDSDNICILLDKIFLECARVK